MGEYTEASHQHWLRFSRKPTAEEYASARATVDTWSLALDIAKESGASDFVTRALEAAAERDGVLIAQRNSLD